MSQHLPRAAGRYPRCPEVKQAADEAGCSRRVVCITGDNPATAAALCRSVGILDAGYRLPADGTPAVGGAALALTGREFGQMDAAAQMVAATSACLFSRTEPTHKLQLPFLSSTCPYH